MTQEGTGELWTLPGRPWADLRLAQSTCDHLCHGWLGDQTPSNEVCFDEASRAYLVFVAEENLFCALTEVGLVRVSWREHCGPPHRSLDWFDEEASDHNRDCWRCRKERLQSAAPWPEPERFMTLAVAARLARAQHKRPREYARRQARLARLREKRTSGL